MKKIKKIAVLTSGGDAPGMNGAIRAVVRTGIYYGYEVVGVKRGFTGLIKGDLQTLHLRDVSDIIQRGGTVLKTSRCPEFKDEKVIKKAIDMCNVFGIDVVIVIGGDGSYRGARDLAKLGMPIMGIPGTIDNDIACTDYTIGFDTAMNTVQDALDKIRDTAYSHERCSVLEVMGRNAGHIALNVAIAGGAEVVLIPEKTYDLDTDVIKPILEGRNRGKADFSVIVAEGVGKVSDISREIEERTGIVSRFTILGYIQRGGSPTVRDRVMASRMGARAVESISLGELNKIISYKDNKIIALDINEALKEVKTIDPELLEIEKILSL